MDRLRQLIFRVTWRSGLVDVGWLNGWELWFYAWKYKKNSSRCPVLRAQSSHFHRATWWMFSQSCQEVSIFRGRLEAVCCAPVMCKRKSVDVWRVQTSCRNSWMNGHTVETCHHNLTPFSLFFPFLKRVVPILFCRICLPRFEWKENFHGDFFFVWPLRTVWKTPSLKPRGPTPCGLVIRRFQWGNLPTN